MKLALHATKIPRAIREEPMSTTHARKGIRWAATITLLFAIQQGEAESSGIVANMAYSTNGTVGTVGITGSPIVGFEGVGDGMLATGGSLFDLGHFVIGNSHEGEI